MQTAIVCVQHARTTLQFVACIMPSKALPFWYGWHYIERYLHSCLIPCMPGFDSVKGLHFMIDEVISGIEK